MSTPAINASSFPPTEALSVNFSSPDSPTLLPAALSPPLPTIIVVFCLFILFVSCTTFLAVCRPSTEVGLPHGGCGLGEPLPCSPSPPSEPQLRLWKRLGSMRRSLTSSFRRPPQRRPDRRASPSTTPPATPQCALPL
ncbi:uncharacterized protein C10orf105-like [Brienomyrus brachyistius]|uniref:uncharacterized protein C10orf105-like n=1 Tax=Brienomyrus brachyistius TaxID=42636 RepID=UPI0020B25135|nr:uncharacterized protein C10orf105-like [Brienomyrus brachyistius]